jgi:hypothetical protein
MEAMAGGSQFMKAAWSLALLCAICATAASADGLSVSEPIVSTVAGNGALGVRNGPALSASFVEPSGVAVGLDGSMYIADAGAQEIRRIRSGVVECFAGRSSPGSYPEQRNGGYADGPVQMAEFNRPVSVAVAKDGTIYVADLGNLRIRKIRQGTVTTLAGAGAQGKDDGVGAAARFEYPKSVAVDDDGNVYVADFGNGIRKITPGGTVTTIAANPKVYAVAARGGGKTLTWAYTAADGIHFNGPSMQDTYAPDRGREPDHEHLTVGNAYGITITSQDSVVVTDMMYSAVRFVRFEGVPMTRALAGGFNEAIPPLGGYRDGPSEIARVDVPLGVTQGPDGSLLVADAGNRRIRKISGLDARSAVTNLGDLSSLKAPKGEYRVVVVGNSFIFHNVLWPESIPGQREAGLIRDGAKIGLKGRPHVTCFRINGLNLFAKKDFIESYLSDGEADLVVFLEDALEHGYDLSARPDLQTGDKWKAVEAEQLRAIASSLEKGGTKFLMVYVPGNGGGLSPLEEIRHRLELSSFLGLAYDTLSERSQDAEVEKAFLSSGVRALSLSGAMVRSEEMPNRVPLFNTRDEHPSPQGATWIGRAVVRYLEQWKPWT